MAKILIVYGTTHGQTRKIAQAIAESLRTGGHQVDVWDSKDIPENLRLDTYGQVIAGGSVYSGRYQRSLMHWIRHNRVTLSRKSGAFFSVCLGILQKDAKARKNEEQAVQRFFHATGWHPSESVIFAGALNYTEYGWLTRWMMKVISGRSGGDTDTSRDYEYTNWDEVRSFASRFAQRMSA